jgi:F420-dependent oxidoreductase-like protein
VKLGLHLSRWDWDGAPLVPTLKAIARLAEDTGFVSLSVMDHFFQLPQIGPVDDPMLEAYTTLGFLAGVTAKIQLGTVVTSVTYRHPGVLVKQVSTLDVLSEGRAFLGIGAGFYEREHVGLGIRLPPVAERMERLYETLQIVKHMWSGDARAFHGRRYELAEMLNAPQVVQRPHPPILIGGGGERKTLRIAAQYADAINLGAALAPDELRHKLEVLRAHCAHVGRDYDSIEKTVQGRFNLTPQGESAAALVDRLHALEDLGFSRVIGSVTAVETLQPLEALGRDVIPHV